MAVLVESDSQVEVARGKFMDKEDSIDMTRLEYEMSFLQVKASMTPCEKSCTRCEAQYV
jgi:hypothetical protein